MRTDIKHSTSFDTHQVIKRLVAKGLKEAQAEEIVHAIIEGRNTDLTQLATKEQLMALDKELIEIKNDLKVLKREVANKADKIDIERTKIQLIMWLGGFIVASTSIIFGFLQYFLSR